MSIKKTRIRRIVRPITDIILHCTDTTANPDITAADVDRWHRQKGWDGIGYHYLIRTDGTVDCGRDLSRPGAHCYGHNAESIGICYVGGCTPDGQHMDTRTPQQHIALVALLRVLHDVWPEATLHGHRDWNAGKDCPCFDAQKEYGFIFSDEEEAG